MISFILALTLIAPPDTARLQKAIEIAIAQTVSESARAASAEVIRIDLSTFSAALDLPEVPPEWASIVRAAGTKGTRQNTEQERVCAAHASAAEKPRCLPPADREVVVRAVKATITASSVTIVTAVDFGVQRKRDRVGDGTFYEVVVSQVGNSYQFESIRKVPIGELLPPSSIIRKAGG